MTPTLPTLYSSVWPSGFVPAAYDSTQASGVSQPLDRNIYSCYSHARSLSPQFEKNLKIVVDVANQLYRMSHTNKQRATKMELKQAEQLAKVLMAEHMSHLTGWRMVFNPRLRRSLGRCHYAKKHIELCPKYVACNAEAQVKDTILHEIAHALCPGHNHDSVWKATAKRIGADGERFANSEKVIPKRKYTLAVKTESGLELLRTTSNTKKDMRGRWLVGRPETINKLLWVEV
jgi:predicted SprT family Zn-dependent metalloprotease